MVQKDKDKDKEIDKDKMLALFTKRNTFTYMPPNTPNTHYIWLFLNNQDFHYQSDVLIYVLLINIYLLDVPPLYI